MLGWSHLEGEALLERSGPDEILVSISVAGRSG